VIGRNSGHFFYDIGFEKYNEKITSIFIKELARYMESLITEIIYERIMRYCN